MSIKPNYPGKNADLALAAMNAASAASDCYPRVTVINLNPREDFCCICGVSVIGGNKGIAMYEGIPVPHDWTGEWGGFCACEDCFQKHERGELETW